MKKEKYICFFPVVVTLAVSSGVDYNISFQIGAVYSFLSIWKRDLLTRLSLSVTVKNT